MFSLHRLLALGILLTTVACSAAASEHKLSFVPPTAAVTVQPAVATPGTPRKIIVSGMWPDACTPTSAKLGAHYSASARLRLGVLLTQPQTFAACAQVLTAYRFELEFTPTAVGQVEILVVNTEAQALAAGRIVTSDAQLPMALHDVSGAWFDPATSGSGVLIAHDYGQGDELFATWTTYDPATGAQRWYWMQQGRWDADGLVWKGHLYESNAAPGPCTAPCSLPIQNVQYRGGVRLAFTTSFIHGGLDATLYAVSADGSERRVSELRRFLPHRIVIQ